jgi:hypothetical protein
MNLLHQTPTPIPSPRGGKRGAAAPAARLTFKAGCLPPPPVGEGWGGGANRPNRTDRRAA